MSETVPYGEIDPLIKPVVRLLNRDNILTKSSCQGGEDHSCDCPTVVVDLQHNWKNATLIKAMTATCLQESGISGFTISIRDMYQTDGSWRPDKHRDIKIEFWQDAEDLFSIFSEEGNYV